MKNMRSSRVLLLVVAFWLVVPGVRAQAARSDTVRVALRYDPTTMNMLETKMGIDFPVVLSINEGLMGADPVTGELKPHLARSLQVLPNKKDIKVTIWKGIRFSTGDPLTATDIQWTYQQVADPRNANLMAGALEELESIEVIDDQSVVFHFYEPFAAWQQLMWIGICSKRYYDRVGPEQFRKVPVGSGVFKFVNRKTGESVTLAVDRNYWAREYRKLPNYKYLQFVTVPDDQTRLAMLETGELDLISDILPHQLRRLQQNKRIKIKRCGQVPSMYGMVGKVFADPGLLKDRNFCQALQHAINRQEIVDKIFLGEGYPLYMYASKSELGYDPRAKVEFNPQKARAYLAKSSYKPGSPVMLTYTSMVPNASLVASSIQQYLRNIGITVTIRQLEAGIEATYSRNKDPKVGPLLLYAWAGGRDPSIRLLISSRSTSPYASYTDRPRQKEMDGLIDAQACEMDVNQRLDLLRRCHDILREDGINVILFGLNMIYATSDRIDYAWVPNEANLYALDRIKIVK